MVSPSARVARALALALALLILGVPVRVLGQVLSWSFVDGTPAGYSVQLYPRFLRDHNSEWNR
jgi:hypothetical protein